MRIETNLHDAPWAAIGTVAQAIERLGFDSLAQAELKRDSFLPLVLAGAATERIRLATAVAIAFPRSPMIVAYEAWNLQELSHGRFVVGLGTQVKGHIERRFSTSWSAPWARLREYVLALRAIWETWQHGAPLNFAGDHYQFTLMTPEFSPAPLPVPPPKIHIAAVNPYNIALAGAVCDGLRVHGFTTPAYTRDVILPNVMAGAAKAGRALADFDLVAGGFIATGATEEEVLKARESIRYRIAFYASTRTYLPVLEHHGWGAMNGELRRLIARSRWDELATVVPDAVLDVFCAAGTYAQIVPALRERYDGQADTIHFPPPKDLTNPSDDYLNTLAALRTFTPLSSRRKGD